MDQPPPSFRKLPLVCEDPTTLWSECVVFARHYDTKWNSCDNRRIHQAFEFYSKQRALSLVWHSNQVEGHGISQRQTYKVLSLYITHLNQTEEVSVWPKVIVDWSESESDAEKDRLGKRQLAQHMHGSFLSLPQRSQTKNIPY